VPMFVVVPAEKPDEEVPSIFIAAESSGECRVVFYREATLPESGKCNCRPPQPRLGNCDTVWLR
jgi:hypothetical protein